MTHWLPIRYRDFWDFPRAFAVEFDRTLFLFDSLFDYETDDYEDQYTVYVVPEDIGERIDDISWTDLGHRCERVGQIAVHAIEFDQSKRRAIDERVFEQIEGLSATSEE